MIRYILRRLLQAIPTLIGVGLISFLLVKSAPGDPIQVMTFSPNIGDETRKEMRIRLGLDQPIAIQYLRWFSGFMVQRGNAVTLLTASGSNCVYSAALGLTLCDTHSGIIRGHLGTSITTQQPVSNRVLERLPATLELTCAGLLWGIVFGVTLGIMGALYHGRGVDNFVRLVSMIGSAVPAFWMGLLLMLLFGVQLHWLPTGGRQSVLLEGRFSLIDALRHLVMPAFVLALGWTTVLSRYMRGEMLEVIHTDYIRTAMAKGLPPFRVWFVHAARNALIPLATALGPAIASLLAGAVVVETIFSWPGMGRLVFDSAVQRDYPMVLGTAMIGSVLVILGNLLSDILYAIVDPRVRLG